MAGYGHELAERTARVIVAGAALRGLAKPFHMAFRALDIEMQGIERLTRALVIELPGLPLQFMASAASDLLREPLHVTIRATGFRVRRVQGNADTRVFEILGRPVRAVAIAATGRKVREPERILLVTGPAIQPGMVTL